MLGSNCIVEVVNIMFSRFSFGVFSSNKNVGKYADPVQTMRFSQSGFKPCLCNSRKPVI